MYKSNKIKRGLTALGYAVICMIALSASLLPQPLTTAQAASQNYVMFSINVQDFSYPEYSIATLNRILDIHEKYGVPVDLYLTTTMTDIYEAQSPALLTRLKTSPVASVSYHVRPPNPYYTNYDWLGLSQLTSTQQYTTVMNYETHGLDLVTGQPTSQTGGYKKLTEVMGYAPYVAANQPDASVGQETSDVFKDLGARFFIQHDRIINLGDKLNGVYLRPEHYDLKLFEHVGEKAKNLIKTAFSEAQAATGAQAPYFVGIKMHDNDFFAVDSAWVTVYTKGSKRPPWDTSKKSALLSDAEQQAVWNQYEATVAYIAAKNSKYKPLNAPLLWQMLGGTITPPAPTAATTLYLSGTMHIETNQSSWPNPDALLAFFARATATGKIANQTTAMRWSVGADIGWLQGEARAAEVIRATEAMGVEWDVHAHEMADRANCSAKLTQLGGHPNHVASGVVATEIDTLRSLVRGSSGASWQAEILWGIVRQANHGVGSDDDAIGVWRPKNSTDWTTHDPNGNLIAVGGGNRRLPEIEAYAGKLSVNAQGLPPVLSATIMVSPKTLTITNTTDGIDAIESWAWRIGALPNIKWANLRETATAWVAAGSVASRLENWQ
ncbi:MAG: hypothetical protein HY231_14085 [Acidobacteria bacterium]|nr:hypothetical protein [Acidobacteriota bacterium]